MLALKFAWFRLAFFVLAQSRVTSDCAARIKTGKKQVFLVDIDLLKHEWFIHEHMLNLLRSILC